MKHNIAVKELRRSLNFVILGISFGIIFFSVINGAPLTGFIRALGVNDFIYSIIMALPMLSNLVQVFAAYFFENSGHRKSSFLIAGFLRILWIPVVLTPLILPAKDYSARIMIITVLIAIYSIANSVTAVSFLAWMGELIPSGIRGRFFSTRTMVFTIVSAGAGLLIGVFLDRLHNFTGFAILFSMVAIFGMIDIACFILVKDPIIQPQMKNSFWELCKKPFQSLNYTRYLLFTVVWNFGINLAAPFFNVYLLENLKMNYFKVFLLSQLVANLTTIFFVGIWGRIVDKYGNKPVLVICGTGMAAVSFIWCLATLDNYFLIIPLIHILIGIFWPGCDITSTNLAIWLAPERNRSAYIAMYNLAASLIGGGLAYICGGAFMEISGPFLAQLNFPFLFGQPLSNFHCLFIITGIVRFVAAYRFIIPVTDGQSKGLKSVLAMMTRGFRK